MPSKTGIRRQTLAGLAATLLASAGHCLAAAPASQLSPIEKRIAVAAGRENEPAIALLEKLVNINSGTSNTAGVEAVGRIMMAELEALGFHTRWVPMTAAGRAGHVVAEHEGSGRGRRMLLIGHLDTVFEADSPFQRFERNGSTAVGPGVNDMKDGLTIMVSALRALRNSGALPDATIRIVLSGDEESVGDPIAIARADMIAAASKSDVALEFEALATQDGHDMGSVSRRSSSSWTLHATSASGHSSSIFADDVGYGAAYELARILDRFRRELREPNATFNIGLIGAGSQVTFSGDSAATVNGKGNVIPGDAWAKGDLRTLSNDQTQRIASRMVAIVGEHLPGTRAEVTFDESYPAMPPTLGNRALLATLNDINAALGVERMAELDPLRRGAGDISFVADRVDGLVGFGGVGHGSHAPGETLDLTSLDRQIKRTALLIHRLATNH